MKKLSPLDNFFIELETKNTPMHIGCVALYDESTMKEGSFNYLSFYSNLYKKVNRLPILRQRLVRTPFNIDYHYWMSDPKFSIEHHVNHIALPKGSSWNDFCKIISQNHEKPIDLNNAPWELTVISEMRDIEELPKKCFAIIFKVHHSLLDGIRATLLMAAVHDAKKETKNTPRDIIIVDREPSKLELYSKAFLNTVQNISLKKNLSLV